jgi:hypothetical protein
MPAASASVDALRARIAAPCLGEFATPAAVRFDAGALRALGLVDPSALRASRPVRPSARRSGLAS